MQKWSHKKIPLFYVENPIHSIFQNDALLLWTTAVLYYFRKSFELLPCSSQHLFFEELEELFAGLSQ